MSSPGEPGSVVPTGEAADRLALLPRSAALQHAKEMLMRADIDKQPIWRALLRRPPVAQAIFRLVSTQLFRSNFDTRRRELAILRIGWVTDCSFEWAQHWSFALELGLRQEDLLQVREWPSQTGTLSAADQAALLAADDVACDGVVSDATWSRMQASMDEDECFDLVLVVTTWTFISSVIRSLAISLPGGMSPWPPDGRAPGASSLS